MTFNLIINKFEKFSVSPPWLCCSGGWWLDGMSAWTRYVFRWDLHLRPFISDWVDERLSQEMCFRANRTISERARKRENWIKRIRKSRQTANGWRKNPIEMKKVSRSKVSCHESKFARRSQPTLPHQNADVVCPRQILIIGNSSVNSLARLEEIRDNPIARQNQLAISRIDG